MVFADYLFTYIGSLVILCIASPLHIVLVLIFGIILMGRIGVYVKISTDISRLTKLASTPILSKISEVLTGYISIRSYGKKDFIWSQFIKNTDLLSNCDMHDRLFTFYMRVVIDLSIQVIMLLSFVFFNINKNTKILFFDDPAQLGLVIAYVMGLINMTGTFVYSLTNFMVEMNSVERIQEYSTWTDHEASWEEGEKPALEWPKTGRLEVKNLWLQYRKGLPYVLKGLNFHVEDGEKVTIIGRTGSGKSTVFLALTRLVELISATKTDKQDKPNLQKENQEQNTLDLQRIQG